MSNRPPVVGSVKPGPRLTVCTLLFSVFLIQGGLRAQEPPVPTRPTDAGRLLATRAQLEADLTRIQQVEASPGVTGELQKEMADEAALIKERLTNGDFAVGDQIALSVQGEATLTGTFTVEDGPVIVLPNLAPVPVGGVLRSEIQGYMTEQIGRFIRDPIVKASPLIRLAMLGSVGKPGFYSLPADMLISDAIMSAGGPAGDMKKTKVMRGQEEIVDEKAVQQAMIDGTTLDQLNLRAGDEIQVASSTPKDFFSRLKRWMIVMGAVLSVIGLGKAFGVW